MVHYPNVSTGGIFLYEIGVGVRGVITIFRSQTEARYTYCAIHSWQRNDAEEEGERKSNGSKNRRCQRSRRRSTTSWGSEQRHAETYEETNADLEDGSRHPMTWKRRRLLWQLWTRGSDELPRMTRLASDRIWSYFRQPIMCIPLTDRLSPSSFQSINKGSGTSRPEPPTREKNDLFEKEKERNQMECSFKRRGDWDLGRKMVNTKNSN